MTEPPRPPGSDDAGRYPPEPTMPLAPSTSPSTPAEPTAPLGGYPPPSSGAPTGTPSYEPPAPSSGGPSASADHPTSGGHFAAAGYPTPESSGGYPPPGGSAGYPPPGTPGGYPPPGTPGGQPPSGGPSSGPGGDDRTWAVIAHAGGPLGLVVGATLLGWVAPLIVMLVRGNESPTVRAHAVAALNFQVTWTVAILLGWLLTAVTCGLLFFIPTLMSIVPIVFGIIAAIKASQDELYQYPMSRQFVR